MKIDLNFQLKNLDGTDMQCDQAHAGRILAQVLAESNKGNSVKLMSWAIKLYDKETIELDDTDLETLRAFVNNTEFLKNLAKYQIINELKK